MPLLNVERYGYKEGVFPAIDGYQAVLHWIGDQDIRHAVVTANINMLRRRAPYTYVFANRTLEDVLPYPREVSDRDYCELMERRQLKRRGMWLTAPEHVEDTETFVIAVLQGDIYPFAYALYSDFNALFCLPEPKSLDHLDEVIDAAESTGDVIVKLLADGGFLLSATDHVVLQILSADPGFREFFPESDIAP